MTLPLITNDVTEENTSITDLGNSFLFDFGKGDFEVIDGKVMKINGILAIKVWIEKILRTEKDRFKIYNNTDYGVILEDLLIGENYTPEFIDAELKREITEALTSHPQIESLTNFIFEKTGTFSLLTIYFDVVLKDGEYLKQEFQI